MEVILKSACQGLEREGRSGFGRMLHRWNLCSGKKGTLGWERPSGAKEGKLMAIEKGAGLPNPLQVLMK
jgi:hypothetical protein